MSAQQNQQDKAKERAFFNAVLDGDGYDVFTPESTAKIIDTIMELGAAKPGMQIADLGCGSGVFSDKLHDRGLKCVGLDLSFNLVRVGTETYVDTHFVNGDVETQPFADDTFDLVVLSGLVHHLPDPSRCAAEVFRILKPGGRFVAFDPNRRNPFMYLYRDRTSPMYSSKGVTENERPVLSEEIAKTFSNVGFKVGSTFLSGLSYTYVESGLVRWLLPVYNAIDSVMFRPWFMNRFSAFVFTYGVKG